MSKSAALISIVFYKIIVVVFHVQPRTYHNRELYERCSFSAGKAVFREGEKAKCAYLVQTGTVRVFMRSGGRKIELARLGPGQIVGEMALLQDGTRNASVEAAEDCTLVLITRQLFQKRMDESDQMIRAILHMLATRIVDSNDTIRQNIHNIEQALYAKVDRMLENLPEDDQSNFRQEALPQISNLLATLETYNKKCTPS